MNYQATTTQYADRLYDFLANLESPERKAYDAKDGTITIGPGYNLTSRSNDLRDLVLKNLGLLIEDKDYEGTDAVRFKEALYLTRLIDALKAGPSQLSELNTIMLERYNAAASDTAYSTYIGTARETFAFSLGTTGDAEMRAVMAEGRKIYEDRLFKQLGFTEATAPEGFVGSKEMVALLSLVYNGLGAFPAGLKKAIVDGNRAEAWYLIRYEANYIGRKVSQGISLQDKPGTEKDEQGYYNAGIDKGWARRRYVESEYFGLYESGTTKDNISEDEARSVGRMWTKYREQISLYEKLYGVWDQQRGTRTSNGSTALELAQTHITALGINSLGSSGVGTIYEELSWYRDKLVNQYITDNEGITTKPTIDGDVLVAETAATGSYGEFGNTGFKGGSQNDLMLGDVGSDWLDASGGDDVLVGGVGNDHLLGGDGTDTYVFKSGDGKDTIIDSHGNGSIVINGRTLDGTQAKLRLNDQHQQEWIEGEGGQQIIYTLNAQKQLTITGVALGGTKITINDFVVGQTNGYLGLKLDNKQEVAVTAVALTKSFWSDVDAKIDDLAGQSSLLTEGGGKKFVVHLKQAAKAGETITLHIANLVDKLAAILGDSKVPADGAVITLVEGQTQVSFSLVNEGEISADLTGSISVSYNGDGQTTTSNTWGLNVKDAGETAKTFIGDQRALLWGVDLQPDPAVNEDGSVTQDIIAPGDPRYNTYAWSKTEWAADGTLTGGVAEVGFNDVIYGSSENDKIQGLGGNDALDGGAGNDQIQGGDGDDLIGGGEGSDNIQGGAGNDYILSAHSLAVPQRQGVNDDWNPPGGETVLLEGSTWGVYVRANGGVMTDGGGSVGRDGTADVIDAGSGDDVVVASHGDDRIDGGSGSDQLEGGGGSDVIEGGTERDFIWGDGPNAAGTYSHTPPEQHGDDFLDGGEGDDQVIGQGGSDVVYGGAGNDYLHGDHTMSHPGYSGPWLLDGAYHGQDYLDGEDGNDAMYGGGRDDVMYGGAGNDVMEGDDTQNQLGGIYHGDDYLDGEEGDDSMAGGGGHDTVYGGSGKDLIYGDSVTDPVHGVAAEFHGNDYLDGEDDDDEIVGGGKDDTLYGGSGNDVLIGDGTDVAGQYHGDDYLDGEGGDDQLLGGGGSDTLYGGAGNDVMYGDDDPALLAADFHGDDYLDGGDGDDQLSGGGSDDVLLGGAGNDLLIGGEGADYMDGGGGDDRYQAGAGDTVVDGAGANSIALSDGEPVAVSASGSDLVLNYDEGSLTIVGALSGGINAIDEMSLGEWLRGRLMDSVQVSTSRDHQTVTGGSGSDELHAEHAYGVLVGGEGGDILVGGEHFVTLDGGAHDDILQTGDGGSEMSGGSGNDSLHAGGGADVLSGGIGNDEIDGGAGDDVLDGGAGDDVIYGGEGSDTLIARSGRDTLYGGSGSDVYVLGYGTGQVTAIDDSSDESVIQLDASGIQIESLRAHRRGNDLLLEVLGTPTSFSIQDYYGSTQMSWVVMGADGGIVATQQLIDASKPQWDLLRSDLYQEFKAWAESSIGQNYASQGYARQGDGRWLLSTELEQVGDVTLQNYSQEASTYWHSGPNWVQLSNTLNWSRSDWGAMHLSVDDVTIAFSDVSRIFSNENLILSSVAESASYQAAWAAIQWDNYATYVGENISLTYGANGLGEYKFVDVQKWYIGRGTSLHFADPGGGASPGPLPGYVNVQFAHNVLDYNLGETQLTDGDHTVWADQYSAVVGGVGDNTIYGAGYAYGGTGAARLIGGEFLMAGSGDQYLQDGRTMVVGDGQTTVAGRAFGVAQVDPLTGDVVGYTQPDTRILVNPSNAGVDLVLSDDATRRDRDGDSWDDAVQSIYAAHGISDIQESYAHGGKYHLLSSEQSYMFRAGASSLDDEDDVVQFYFDSLEEAREAYAQRSGQSNIPFEEMVAYIKPLPFIIKSLISNPWDSEASSYYTENGVRTIALSGNNFGAVQEFVQTGALPRRIVSFGQGLSLAEISLSWGMAESPLDGLSRVTLDLKWGDDQGLRIMIPRTGDAINGTVREFEFADGSAFTLAELISAAPPAPSFDPDFVSLDVGDGHRAVAVDEIPGIRITVEEIGDVLLSNTGSEGVDLRLAINNGQDSLTIKNWFAGSQYQADVIVTLLGGSFFTVHELAAMAIAGTENPSDDALVGTDGADVLNGGFGDDRLEGDVGNDILIGGAGNDELIDQGGNNLFLAGYGEDYLLADAGSAFMIGGRGADQYGGYAANSIIAYNVGDESDVISIRENVTISLGGGISPDDIFVSGDGYHLYLHLNDDDVLQLRYYDYYGYSDIRLQIIDADIRVYDLGAVLAVYELDNPSEVKQPIADMLAAHLISASSDAAIGGRLAFEYATAGNLNALSVEDIQAILAEPSFGGAVQDISTEHAPTLNLPVADLATSQPLALSHQFAAETFTDVDAGDVLVWSLTQADGQPLPDWLAFDATTRTLSGTPRNRNAGELELLLTVTDTTGLSANQEFTLTVHETEGVLVTGTADADVLTGGAGDDLIDGGAGADRMVGGDGEDRYVVDNTRDVVVEEADHGADRVEAYVSYVAPANVEAIALMGEANISAKGNDLDNRLEGNTGNNRLDGGTGADQLLGGVGNDTYVVDEIGDVVTELADEGTDTVQSLVDYTLGANLENLTLTGAAATSGAGNELNNVITGNVAGNTLRGLGGNDTLRGGLEADILDGGEGNDRLDGGTGADQLIGGLGNDVYVVDEASDVVLELADEGTDTVQSLVDYTLGANLENLTLTGTAATSGTGNEFNNVITGNAAGNTLRGLGGNDTLRGGLEADVLEGGEGNDRLEGGLGADTYLFSRGEGQDTVVDTDSTLGVSDVLQFGADISAEQIWLRKSGNHLEISLLGTTDKLTVANWYLGEDRRVEVLQLANGQQLLDTQVQNLVQAMAAFAPPAAGQTTLPESYASTLNPVIAANWQ